MARNSTPQQDPAARALAVLLRDIVASARQPLDAPDMTDAVAIHDFRKAFKRWRALMRLIGPVIGAEAEALRIEVRDIAREMASAPANSTAGRPPASSRRPTAGSARASPRTGRRRRPSTCTGCASASSNTATRWN